MSVIEREDLGSWLEGAPSNQQYPGQHLGRPESGPGSIARGGRRILAFIIDWFLCYGLMALVGLGGSSIAENTAVLVLFWLYQTVCVGFMGHTLGHLLLGLQVQRMDGAPAGWISGLVRATLVMLVLPVIIMDSDQRGLHDRARHTLLVRIR
ncbi:RDD family protein [Rothia aerolata]|uniref:RDD family protein n=1 Tax=Rothia aerolata TaxID=1812262 RepID=UPI002811E549|nr:RDD family protein [Rothia aerolata]